jgi:hypothetical protein
MLTSEEMDKKLISGRRLEMFTVIDPLPKDLKIPTYENDENDENMKEFGKVDVVVGSAHDLPEILPFEHHIEVPLYEFDDFKHFLNMFSMTLLSAVETSGNIHTCQVFDWNFIKSLFKDYPGAAQHCSHILGKFDDDEKWKDIFKYYSDINEYYFVSEPYLNTKSNMIFCFPDPEYSGVIPLGSDNKFGLMLVTKFIHAINILDWETKNQ